MRLLRHPLRSGLRRQRGAPGFSLVEVTLALGIVSFGVFVMVAVNTTSLKILGQARDAELGRNIHRTISAELLSAPFGTLPAAGQMSTRFFDGAGFEVADRSQANYRAQVIGRGGVSAGRTALSDDVSRVFEVRIEPSPGGNEVTNPPLLFSGPVLVGRREKD